MPRTIRFHLDENTDPAITAGLRRHGIDVTTSQEMRLLGAVDIVQLAHAHAEQRVLFTHDSDHLTLSAQGIEHSGLAYCHQKKHSIGQIIVGLILIWEVLEPDEMRNRVEFI
jgi:predicted nuclease of predicted toxin-antitoxin system